MNVIELIEKKKQGQAFSYDELKYLIENYMSGEIADYQISALLMAIYFQGMNIEETTYLTDLTVKSGAVLDFSDISPDVVDKHSTGGVGDKITLILLPLLAAAGITTAKLSGRGLGFTGGTIDKLEAIPGFNTDLKTDEFFELVKTQNTAIAAQTLDLTPADGKMYALRDVTGTVDIIPLIACSVVSKKIASGANHIILDVKCGKGAFIKDVEMAKKLADTMTQVGERLGRNVCCIITNMDMPLGRAVGNALEIIEVIEFLKGNVCDDLAELTYEIAAISLLKTKKFDNKNAAIEYLKDLVHSGKALAKFKEIIENQGGNSEILNNYNLLPQSRVKIEVKAESNGYVTDIDAIMIAKASKLLGAGRTKKTDIIDYAVGVYLNKKHGEKVTEGEAIATLHVNDEKNLAEAIELVKNAYSFSETQPEKAIMIYETI